MVKTVSFKRLISASGSAPGEHDGRPRTPDFLTLSFIGFGGKEVPVNDYEVLTSPVIRGLR
jgi:hypothetical protein